VIAYFKPTARGESTDRTPIDYFHFGIIFLGIILGAAGVIALSLGMFVFGLLLVASGVAYFIMEE
jgi:hypothetical protein